MSLTVSPGITKASQWVVVAAVASDYLERLLGALESGNAAPEHPPQAAIASAEYFFRSVRDGVAQRRNGTSSQSAPPMAGITSLSIAAGVMPEVVSSKEDPLTVIDASASLHLETLRLLACTDYAHLKSDSVRQLLHFLRDLERRGESESPDELTAPVRTEPSALDD